MQKNIPYVKKYNEEGLVANPINHAYVNNFPNRSERHANLGRHKGNGRNFHLSVHPKARYHRTVQEIVLKDGSIKRINHLIPC